MPDKLTQPYYGRCIWCNTELTILNFDQFKHEDNKYCSQECIDDYKKSFDYYKLCEVNDYVSRKY